MYWQCFYGNISFEHACEIFVCNRLNNILMKTFENVLDTILVKTCFINENIGTLSADTFILTLLHGNISNDLYGQISTDAFL